ncbi:MAG: TonB-dependent receptor domain-containing protein, partial [Flavisolibacter sp.]
VLQNLPANTIERIEVITNPSARYRPDGTSGIINIVLKKNVRNGFNGTVSFNAGNKDRYNGNISLNYRPKKFNLFTSYSFRYDTRLRFNTIERINLDSFSFLPKSFFNQNTKSVARPQTHIFSGGIDYTLDEQNSLGASASYYQRYQLRNEVASNISLDNSHIITQNFDRLRHVPEQENQVNGTVYFQRNFSKENHDLRLEFNTSVEEEKEDNLYTNVFTQPARPSTKDNTLVREKNEQNQLTIDYSNELSENSKLEAGYDGLFNKSDLDFYGEYYDNTLNEFVKDQVKSNRFIYDEKVHAVYATYQKAFEKFGYQAGLRSEAVFTKGHLIDLDSVVKNNYFKIYPTIHLSYKLKEDKELQLNYSKRVNRPEADELNPFPEFQDPRNLRAGNPKLLPEIIHSVEFGYKWQNRIFTFVPSIYYRYKENGFTSVTLQLNDSTLLTTEQNLSNDQSAGLEAIISAKAGGFFNATLSANIFYNRIDASNLGYIQNNSIYSGSATLTSSFSLTKTTMLQISSNYRSARLTPQGKSYPWVVLNSGIRQDFLKNKLSVTITASDIFSSQRQKTELNTPYMHQFSTGRRDGFIIFLGINYRFGIIKKEKDENLEFDNNL